MSDSNLEWFAIRVKSRCEKMVSVQLQQKGYEEFLPMYWSRRLWSDRVKVMEVPCGEGVDDVPSSMVVVFLPTVRTSGVVEEPA